MLLNNFLLLLLVAFSAHAGSENYPLRKEFPNAVPITAAGLLKQYDKSFVVDVRSAFEFDVVHIGKAVNIPMNNRSLFLSNLEGVRDKASTEPIILYCNGIKCKKSYEAADYAMSGGFKNIYVFDAGVITWLKTYPDRTYLLGKMPANPSKIISDEKFESAMVNFSEFKKASQNPDAIIFDVRDATQKTKLIDLANVKSIELDHVLVLLKKNLYKDKQIYFIDTVGKQVEWLQYYLIENGYKNYHFLKGGTDAI